MNKNKNGNIGLNPIKTEKQRIVSDKLKRSARYNYTDMDEETALLQIGFSKKLAALRIEKDVSAREMSLSLGQNPSYINDIESGRSLPSMAMFFEICEYLGTKPEEFFGYEDNPDKLLTSVFIKEFDRLPRKDQIIILELTERLLK